VYVLTHPRTVAQVSCRMSSLVPHIWADPRRTLASAAVDRRNQGDGGPRENDRRVCRIWRENIVRLFFLLAYVREKFDDEAYVSSYHNMCRFNSGVNLPSSFNPPELLTKILSSFSTTNYYKSPVLLACRVRFTFHTNNSPITT
jgi:hypothetical protein